MKKEGGKERKVTDGGNEDEGRQGILRGGEEGSGGGGTGGACV